MKKTLIITTMAALAVLLSGCGDPAEKETKAAAPDSAAPDSFTPAESGEQGKLIASVNGVPIYESRLRIYQPLAGPNTSREDLIENVIISELLAQKAEQMDLAKDNADLAEQLSIAQQTVLGRAYAESYVNGKEVSDDEIQSRYNEMKTQFSGQKEYETSHILVPDEAQANDLLAQLKKDNSLFKEFAQKHSQDPGSGGQGGALGWVNPEGVVPEFGEAMVAASPGTIYPQAVKSQFGWHLLFVHNARELPIPELTSELYDNIKININREKFSKHLDTLKSEAKIERP